MVYSLGDKVTTKNMHPNKKKKKTIVRTGADYKIRCDKCGRIVMLSVSDFNKAIKAKKEQ